MHLYSLGFLVCFHRSALGYTSPDDMQLHSLGFLGLFPVDFTAPEAPLGYTSRYDMRLHSLAFLGIFPVDLAASEAPVGYTSPDNMQVRRRRWFVWFLLDSSLSYLV
jgi:hypothetical protein